MNVRTLCLGILSVGEASGYEIKKDIEEGMFSHFIDASFGSIYPALTQLAARRAGDGAGRGADRQARQEGLRHHREGAGAWPSRLPLFRPRTNTSRSSCSRCCCSNISARLMLAAIDKQLADLQGSGAYRRVQGGQQAHAGAVFVADYGEAVLTAAVKYLEETAGRPSWRHGAPGSGGVKRNA